MDQKWYQRSLRRNLVDMHIADWDERFLSEFDPETYVETVRSAGTTAAMVYAHSHVGHCYYPTQIGHQHASLHGRDIFGEVVEGFHKRGMDVIAYFSLIYDDYAYRKNPDWRMVNSHGEGAAEHSRYGINCPNSPYRDYTTAHAVELCSRYPFESIFLDMTFWPVVCYCPHCQKRFADEVGGSLPKIINWDDPLWVRFQRKREEWLVEFAKHVTAAIRSAAPHVTIQHQASTYLAGWRLGVTEPLAEANSYLGGDFYGDALQGSVVRKLFHNLSPSLPAEFQTSFSINLRNHTARKSEELLRAKASASLADGTAFLFIDAIDPVGTLNPDTYGRMRRVFEQTQAYEPFIGGELVQDVAIYASLKSKFDPADNGKAVDDPGLSSKQPHIDTVISVAQALIRGHVPYGVITRHNLGQLNRHKVIILPDVLALDNDEAQALREYVRGGGAIYASRRTSLSTPDGVRHPDFSLADVLGVSFSGQTSEAYTYIAPETGQESTFSGYSRKWPLAVDHAQILISAHENTQVLASLVLPYTNPADPRHFASIHSNPPGIYTGYPAVVMHNYGSGKAIYSAGCLESMDIHADTFLHLIRLLAGFTVEADAPGCVELTLFHQPEKHRYLVGLVNFQKEMPNIPVTGIQVRLHLGQGIQRLVMLPNEDGQPFEAANGWVKFEVPALETLGMFAVDYESA